MAQAVGYHRPFHGLHEPSLCPLGAPLPSAAGAVVAPPNSLRLAPAAPAATNTTRTPPTPALAATGVPAHGRAVLAIVPPVPVALHPAASHHQRLVASRPAGMPVTAAPTPNGTWQARPPTLMPQPVRYVHGPGGAVALVLAPRGPASGGVPVAAAPLRATSACVGADAAGAAPVPDCAICLGTSEPGPACRLGCGHLFCKQCIAQYIQSRAKDRQVAACPNCKRAIAEADLLACLPPEVVEALLDPDSHATPEVVLELDEEAERAFLDAAHDLGVRCCPACHARIIKEGGCNMVTCRCGHQFDWSTTALDVSCQCCQSRWGCHQVHGTHICGSVCGRASPIAYTRLVIRRVGLAVGIVIVVPVAVAAFLIFAASMAVVGTGAQLGHAISALADHWARRRRREARRRRRAARRAGTLAEEEKEA